ncbi:uncharacterized protein LOC128649177 isoform X2 [Bombina bombina]|uniref:uncharacterized protein LOC128649177 isoform X2 n=1 Tax=Bombina bombina TaxID=8345 RepID=UPI00235AB9FC|nr:uncharacterized protein LOC128649177 isoform X2 [Bombina bombina]
MVTVTTVEKSSGNVFPLVPCCEMPSKDHIHIGCLYSDVFPHPGPFIWEALPSASLTSYDFPHALVKDKYSFVSYIIIPSNDWDSKTYTCTPSQKSKETKSNTLGKTLKKKVCEKKAPILKISLTSCAGDTEDNMVYLVCTVFNFPSGHGEVTWLQNGKNYVRTGNSVAKAKDMVFMLNVSKESWNKEDEYTCQLQYQNEIKMENISKCLACYSSFMKPTVVSSKPSIEDILNNKIEISCSVHNININPGTKQVFLKVDGQQFGKVAREELTKNSIKATFTMNREEWDKMKTVSCLVKQPCSGSDIEEVVKINHKSTKMPTVSANRTMFLDEGGIAAVCKASGFYPDEISIHWEKENQKMEAGNYINSPVTCSGSTCFTMSFLKASKQDNLASYKCVVYHLSLNSPQKMDIEDISELPPIVPEAQILNPSIKDVFLNKFIDFSCRTNVPNTAITWEITPNGNFNQIPDKPKAISPKDTKWILSTVQFSFTEWKSIVNVTCKLKPPQDVIPTSLSIKSTYLTGKMKSPRVHLFIAASENGISENQLTLICLVKSFYPAYLLVTWNLNGTEVKQEAPGPEEISCHPQNQDCTFVSQLSTTKVSLLNRTTYMCQVAHISLDVHIMKNISAPIDASCIEPSNTKSKASFRDLFLNENKYISCKKNVLTAAFNLVKKTNISFDEIICQQRSIQVSLQEWKNISNVTCELKSQKDVCPSSESIMSEKTKQPIVHIMPPATQGVTSDNKLTLICLVKEFYPEDLFVMWEENETTISEDIPDTNEIYCNHKKRDCSVISHLSVSMTDWLKGTNYSCLVAHISTEVFIRANIRSNIKDSFETPLSEPLAQILKPSFKDLFINKTANISCRTNAPKTNITWLADGNQIEAETDEELSQLNNTTLWFQSTLKVPMENWKKTSNFTCILNYHQNSAQKTLNIQTKQRDLQAPIVQLLMSTPEDVTVKNQLMLLCLVKDFYPEELFVAWRVLNITTQEDNPQPITIQEDNPQPNVVKCHHQSKHCSYISELSIEKEAWLSGAVYTCEVAHLSSEDYITKSINFKSGTTYTYIPEICDPREGEDISDVEDANNVWPTASTFIALFLLTLIYSSFVTFIKVK